MHLEPLDNESLHWATRLGGRLPSQALAARGLPRGRRVRILTGVPLNASCATSTEAPAAFFVRPYHTSNMCHLYNEALLPMAHLMQSVPSPRDLYFYGDHMTRERPLRHWDVVAHLIAGRVEPATNFFGCAGPATERPFSRSTREASEWRAR